MLSERRLLLFTQFLSCSFATQWTVAHQTSLSVGFPRQEHWSGLPFPSPGDLPDPGIEPESPALTHGFFTTEPPGTHVIIGSWARRDSRRNVVQWMGRSKLRGAEPCPVPQSSQGRLSTAKINPALLPSLFFLFIGPLCVCGHTCADQGCLLQLWKKWKPEPTTATWSGAIAPLSSPGSGVLGVGLLQSVQFTASTMSQVLPVLALGQAPLPRWASLSSLWSR